MWQLGWATVPRYLAKHIQGVSVRVVLEERSSELGDLE